jgi:NitT/TauT family transport system permease protein
MMDLPQRPTAHALLDRLAPSLFGLGIIGVWESLVRLFDIPVYLLPGPLLIGETLWRDGP